MTRCILPHGLLISMARGRALCRRGAVSRVTVGVLATAVLGGTGAASHDVGRPSGTEADVEAAGGNAYLALGESISLGPFEVTLADVDTLKTKRSSDGVEPWEFNARFGEGLDRFLGVGASRLAREFRASARDLRALWPTSAEIAAIEAADHPSRAWQALMERLSIEVESVETGRPVSLRAAFSRWPLARLEVRRRGEAAPLLDAYFPEGDTVDLEGSTGEKLRLTVVTIFNGDRDIGETEACVVRLRSGTGGG